MTGLTKLATVEAVRDAGSLLFTMADPRDDPEEVVLVPCAGPAPSTRVEGSH